MTTPKIKIKKIVSWAIAVPAIIFAAGEIKDLTYWYVPFLALGILVAIIWWNGGFIKSQEESY